MALRLFTGIRIPEALHDRLASLQSGVPDAKWVRPENFHITLSFIGDVEEPVAGEVHEVLKDIAGKRFSLTLSGTGSFGARQPKLLWAGVEASSPLAELQARVAGRLARAGLPLETRKYSPHVTLAYMRGRNVPKARLAQWFEQTGPFLSTPFEVTRFSLIESRLGSAGSHYEDIERYELA